MPLVILFTLAGCDPTLDEQGRQMALAGDGVSVGLEGSFKAGWVVGDADPTALSVTKDVINSLFGLCASAAELPSGLRIEFNGDCGVPFTDLRFEGALAFQAANGTLALSFTRLHLPSIVLDGSADFTRLRDGDFTWQYRSLAVELGDHHFVLDGSGSVRYSSDRTSVRFDGAGHVDGEAMSIWYIADGIERRLIDGCWPERGTLTLRLTAMGVTHSLIFHYTGDRTVHLEDRGRTLDHDLPDRNCHPLF